MRYVFYTSGPRAFNKFLKQYFYSNNIISLNTILFDKGITNDAIPYDIVMEYYQIKFYSFHSQSYKEEIHEGKIVCTKYNNKKSIPIVYYSILKYILIIITIKLYIVYP